MLLFEMLSRCSAGSRRIVDSGTANTAYVTGGADNDSLTFNKVTLLSGTTVNGNKGADEIKVLTGAVMDVTTIHGGSGNDTIDLVDTRTTISGDKGEDTLVSGTAAKVSVSGGEGDDKITGEATAGNGV